jgi:hypothetical protein
MRVVTRSQHEERVEAVIDIIQGMTGKDTVSEALKHKLHQMSFDDLGKFVMDLVTTRSVDELLEH